MGLVASEQQVNSSCYCCNIYRESPLNWGGSKTVGDSYDRSNGGDEHLKIFENPKCGQRNLHRNCHSLSNKDDQRSFDYGRRSSQRTMGLGPHLGNGGARPVPGTTAPGAASAPGAISIIGSFRGRRRQHLPRDGWTGPNCGIRQQAPVHCGSSLGMSALYRNPGKGT